MVDKNKYIRPEPNDVVVGGKVGRLLLLKELLIFFLMRNTLNSI